MPEQELAVFVSELYDMYMNSVYSVPDIHPSNVLYDGRGFSVIDSQVIDAETKRQNRAGLEGSFVNDLLNLFFMNNEIFEMSSGLLYSLKNKRSVNFSYLKNKNEKVCKAAILKTVAVMNKYCDNPVVREARMKMLVFSTLNNVLTMEDVVEVMGNIHFSQPGE